MWNEVGYSQQYITGSNQPNSGWAGSWDPFISASDDLSTFARLTQRQGYPVLHTWDGRGNPSLGTMIYDSVGTMIVMSGDGNTIYYGPNVSKRSWPSSR